MGSSLFSLCTYINYFLESRGLISAASNCQCYVSGTLQSYKKDLKGMFPTKLKTMESIQSLSLQRVNFTKVRNQMQIHPPIS